MKKEENVNDNLLTKATISSKTNFDLSEITGGDGFWQRRICFIGLILHVPVAFHIYSLSFLAPNIDHWCARPPEFRNLSVEAWRSLVTPSSDKHCSTYMHNNLTHSEKKWLNISEQTTIPCKAWEYDTTSYKSTILSQFDLVCDRQWLVSFSKSVFIAGMSSSLVLFGHLSDRIGRKPVIIISSFVTFFASIISPFSTTFATFLIARFFIAFGVTAFMSTPFVLLMEVVAPKYRILYGMAVQFGWALGCLILPLISWLIRDSFWIQIAITSPCIAFFAIAWLPESPRWLINQGKTKEAKNILLTAAKTNGIKPSEEDMEALDILMSKRLETHKHSEGKGNVLYLLKTPGLFKITVYVYFIWFVLAFVYYGLSINTNELSGDPFINFALMGVVEIPADLLTALLVGPLGQKRVLTATVMISGVACFISYLVPSNLWWVILMLVMIGKCTISAAFGIIYVFSSELFPTVVRNIGVGIASLFGRFGALTAPFMREVGYATHPIFPQIIFGVLAIASGFLVILLPETKNCSVPDTMEEAAELSRKKNYQLAKDVKEKCTTVKLTEVAANNEQDDQNVLDAKTASLV